MLFNVTLLLFLDPCNSELIIFIHLHSNADFIHTPGISSEKITSFQF